MTHDARTLRYPDPDLSEHDTVMIDLETGKVKEILKFTIGKLCMVTGGKNNGRVGTIVHRERHPGSFDIVQVRDSLGHTFATRISNVFVIGEKKPLVSLPRGKGVRLTIAEERDRRLAEKAKSA